MIYNVSRKAPIAQLDRAFGYGPKGLGFESLWARHYDNLRTLYKIKGSFYFTILD